MCLFCALFCIHVKFHNKIGLKKKEGERNAQFVKRHSAKEGPAPRGLPAGVGSSLGPEDRLLSSPLDAPAFLPFSSTKWCWPRLVSGPHSSRLLDQSSARGEPSWGASPSPPDPAVMPGKGQSGGPQFLPIETALADSPGERGGLTMGGSRSGPLHPLAMCWPSPQEPELSCPP